MELGPKTSAVLWALRCSPEPHQNGWVRMLHFMYWIQWDTRWNRASLMAFISYWVLVPKLPFFFFFFPPISLMVYFYKNRQNHGFILLVWLSLSDQSAFLWSCYGNCWCWSSSFLWVGRKGGNYSNINPLFVVLLISNLQDTANTVLVLQKGD